MHKHDIIQLHGCASRTPEQGHTLHTGWVRLGNILGGDYSARPGDSSFGGIFEANYMMTTFHAQCPICLGSVKRFGAMGRFCFCDGHDP